MKAKELIQWIQVEMITGEEEIVYISSTPTAFTPESIEDLYIDGEYSTLSVYISDDKKIIFIDIAPIWTEQVR
jgi:hypothetical protein